MSYDTENYTDADCAEAGPGAGGPLSANLILSKVGISKLAIITSRSATSFRLRNIRLPKRLCTVGLPNPVITYKTVRFVTESDARFMTEHEIALKICV